MLDKFDAFRLSKELYRRCKKLRLPDHLYQQLQRASSSVALNVAEGSGKPTAAEQKRFYAISLGSLRETEAILSLEEAWDPELKQLVDSLGAILFTLSRRPTRPFQPRDER